VKYKWWVDCLDGGGIADTLDDAHKAAHKALSDLGVDSVEYRVSLATHVLDIEQIDFNQIANEMVISLDSSIDNTGDFVLFNSLCVGELFELGNQIKLAIKAITIDKPEFYIQAINSEGFSSSLFSYKKDK